MTVDLAKVRRGDLVLIYSPSGRDGLGDWSCGLHVVLDVGAGGVSVVPAATLDSAHNFKARAVDIVAVLRPVPVDVAALPASKPMDLETMPAPPPAAVVRHPEPAPGRPTTVHVIARSSAVEFFSRYFGRTVHYDIGAVVDRREDGQLVRAFDSVDSNDVAQFIHDLDPIAYLPGHAPDPLAATARDRGFSEDD